MMDTTTVFAHLGSQTFRVSHSWEILNCSHIDTQAHYRMDVIRPKELLYLSPLSIWRKDSIAAAAAATLLTDSQLLSVVYHQPIMEVKAGIC